MKSFRSIRLLALALIAGRVYLAAADKLRMEKAVDAMASVYSVIVYGDDETRMEEALDAALVEARRLDRMLSNYRFDSEWSGVNRYAAEAPVKVSSELFRLLSACLEYSSQSEGAFEISVGPLMKTWGFYRGTGNLPSTAEVKLSLEKVGYRYILLDAANQTVRFAKKGVELDPGGIGKGYAVDRMAEILRNKGVETALISGGGSSIYAMGAPPGETGWNVKFRDPRDETKTTIEVFLKNESMSTSGSYEKFFMAGGKMYSHIMDPRTGFPAGGMIAVSVIAPRALDSEAWTKPVFIQGRKWAAQHIPKGFRAIVCEDNTSGTGSDQPCVWLQ